MTEAKRRDSFIVRPATKDDWTAIWPFFASTVAAGETYAYPPDLTSDQGAALWMERPPGQTVVLETDGQVLGSAKMGPNRPGAGVHIGTASFLVDEQARGRGVGRLLAEHAVSWHRQRGFRGIQFNAVVETNVAAVGLWQSLGFQIIGTVPGGFFSPTRGYVGLHVMFLDLTGPEHASDKSVVLGPSRSLPCNG